MPAITDSRPLPEAFVQRQHAGPVAVESCLRATVTGNPQAPLTPPSGERASSTYNLTRLLVSTYYRAE